MFCQEYWCRKGDGLGLSEAELKSLVESAVVRVEKIVDAAIEPYLGYLSGSDPFLFCQELCDIREKIYGAEIAKNVLHFVGCDSSKRSYFMSLSRTGDPRQKWIWTIQEDKSGESCAFFGHAVAEQHWLGLYRPRPLRYLFVEGQVWRNGRDSFKIVKADRLYGKVEIVKDEPRTLSWRKLERIVMMKDYEISGS